MRWHILFASPFAALFILFAVFGLPHGEFQAEFVCVIAAVGAFFVGIWLAENDRKKRMSREEVKAWVEYELGRVLNRR
jgi:predicted Kef-type K+ transport protein